LVCAKSDDKLKSVPIGTVLLSAYLIASKLHNHEFAILEVAGGYKNIKAYCLYDRFGFIENIDIKNETCFDLEDTIPMIADLKKISIEQIINTLNRSNGGITSHDSLCSIKDKSLLDAEIIKRDGLFKQISEKNIKLNEEKLKKEKLEKEKKNKLNKEKEKLKEEKEEILKNLLGKKDKLETLIRRNKHWLAEAIERIEAAGNPTAVVLEPYNKFYGSAEELRNRNKQQFDLRDRIIEEEVYKHEKKVYIKELKKLQTQLDIVNKDLKIQQKIIIITR